MMVGSLGLEALELFHWTVGSYDLMKMMSLESCIFEGTLFLTVMVKSR